LHHPYIARLLDGGVTGEGELYLAMEYVDGVPIHRFCEQRHLSQAQRIRLFMRACEAVQFAHQNFVVHRDLKPDNILVAADGAPRLLDFGTAKLLSPSLDKQDSQLTREGYLSFTPQYASPEQIMGNPITTASDTYSLGVLLYLLLTKTQPYELKDLTMGQMMKTVCDEAPRKPSSIAGPEKPLDADLEAILLKALRKEPQERYLTAERLADDLRAYLEGQPVAARRGTARYRASKFIRRHRWALGGAAVLLITLIAGVAGVAWQARVANRERRMAVARSADLRQLSNSLLTELDDAIQQIPGSTGAQKLLVTSVLEHLDRMAADAQGDRQTQLDLADAYTRLANLQGNSYEQNVGDVPGALVSINKAIALSEPLVGPGSKDREALRALAFAQSSRSQVLFGSAPIQESVASMQAAIATYGRLRAIPGITTEEICEAARAYGTLGDELGTNGSESLNDPASALSAYRSDLDLMNQALQMDPNLERAKRGIVVILLSMGAIDRETDPGQALEYFQLGQKRLANLPGTEQGNLRIVRLREHLLQEEANALVQLGEYAKASELRTGIVQSSRKLAAADPKDLRALADLEISLDDEALDYETAADPALGATAAGRLQSLEAAQKILSEELAVVENMLKLNGSQDEWRPIRADVQVRLGSTRSVLHSVSASAELVRRGLAELKALAAKDQVSPDILESAAEDYLTAEPPILRNPQLALSYSERAVAQSHRRVPSILLTLAQAYRATDQMEKSRATAMEGLALLPAGQTGIPKSRLRKLLEVLVQRSH
jgi:hypothetical protein